MDTPKPGAVNFNDGNTARIFFEQAETSAAITGIDSSLIERFRVILQVLCCKFEIDADKFEQYALETKAHLESLYPWYELTPTVHKILDHAADVIRFLPVAVGVFTEEAQEARHKEVRRFRLYRTRKCSNGKSNLDLFDRLLVSSDLAVAERRRPVKSKQRALEPAAQELLKRPTESGTDNASGDSDCMEDRDNMSDKSSSDAESSEESAD